MRKSIQFVIPAAGLGSRFKMEGYKTQKPLILIGDVPMLIWVVINLGITKNDKLILVVHKNHEIKQNLEYWFDLLGISPSYVELSDISQGPAESVYLAREYINWTDPLVVANSDQIVAYHLENFYLEFIDNPIDGAVLTMFAKGDKWSYVTTNETDLITQVAEKKEISNIATVGIYGWSIAQTFLDSYDQMVDLNDRTNNEYYVAPSYNYAIGANKSIKSILIGNVEDQVHGLGTPEDYNKFLQSDQFKNLVFKNKTDFDKLQEIINFLDKTNE